MTGDQALDTTLNALVAGGNETWASLADLVPMPCDDTQPMTHPGCADSPPGTRVLAFYLGGCNPAFARTKADAASAVVRELSQAAAWEIYGVIRGGIPSLTDDGYQMIVRVATGNGGDVWYLSSIGRIIGLKRACGPGVVPEFDFKNATFVYGPCFGGCATPTSTP